MFELYYLYGMWKGNNILQSIHTKKVLKRYCSFYPKQILLKLNQQTTIEL